MTFNEMIKGLQILAKYEDKGLEAYLNGADHDVIWAATAEVDEEALDNPDEEEERDLEDNRISKEDNQRLKDLGWFIAPEYAEAWTHYC